MGGMGRGGATLGCLVCVLFATACYQPVVVAAAECRTGDCEQAPEALVPARKIQDPLGSYDLTFVCTNNCTGTFPHTMTITEWEAASGAFSGVGTLQFDASYTWTVSGTINPPDVSFTIIYTGSNPGYTAREIGLIDPSGGMSGTATSSFNQTLDWTATRRP